MTMFAAGDLATIFTSGESKARDLTINIDTDNTIGPRGLPLLYGHPDALTILNATVKFESSHDCKAKAVEISFKAAARTHFFSKDETSRKHEGEQVFYLKHWDMEVEQPKLGWISKGSYARRCPVLLDAAYPSSNDSPFGSMRYIFEARLKGAKGFGIARTDWVVTQEVWVLNASLPLYSSITMDSPVVVEEQWRDTLPYSLSIPADTSHFGQVVPLTIELQPFKEGTIFAGQEAMVTSASITLREQKIFRAMFVRDIHNTSEKLLHITVNTGWPQSMDGWQRTIHVSLPSSPAMSADMQTKYLDVTHSLVVVVEFKTSMMSKPEKLRAQIDIKITAPRLLSAAAPPQYADTAVHVESLLMLEPPPALDAQEPLPVYARYE